MSGFTRVNRGLKDTFPVSGLQLHEPGFLSDDVQLVHPVFGPLTRIGSSERRTEQQVGAAGVATLVVATAPAETVRAIDFCSVSHNDPVARHIRYRVDNNTGGVVVTIQSSQFEGPGAAVPTDVMYPLWRRVYLGPFEVMTVNVAALAAGQVVTVNLMFCDYRPADEPF